MHKTNCMQSMKIFQHGKYLVAYVLKKIVEIKDFSRLLSDFPVLFKADLIFKDFSRKSSKLKYFSSLCEPWISHSFDL